MAVAYELWYILKVLMIIMPISYPYSLANLTTWLLILTGLTVKCSTGMYPSSLPIHPIYSADFRQTVITNEIDRIRRINNGQ